MTTMCRYSLDAPAAADAIEAAVDGVLSAGYRTADIASAQTPDDTVQNLVGTREMGDRVLELMEQNL